MALKAKGKRAIQAFIDDGIEFKHETLSGKAFGQWLDVPLGRLENPRYGESAAYMSVLVLFSYGTPIAWRFTNETSWTVPAVKYSVTTTNHQNVARVAIDNPGHYKDVKW